MIAAGAPICQPALEVGYSSFHILVVRSVRHSPDFTGPPEGKHYGKPWADRAAVVKKV
jgi:hypothetical protein